MNALDLPAGLRPLPGAAVRPPRFRRRHLFMAAALAGGALGGLFGSDAAGEVAHAAAGLWSDRLVPAFFDLLLSGVPFCM